MNALHIREVPALKGQLLEVGAYLDEDGKPVHGTEYAVATLLMPIDDLRRLAEVMFEWGEFTFSVARIVREDGSVQETPP